MTKRFSTVIIFLGLGMARFCRSDNLIRPWESAGLWAPAAGLGYAYTAVADDPETVFSNIAGLTQMSAATLRYSHRPYNLDPNYDSFAYAQPFGDRGSSFGLGLNAARYGSGPAYTEAVAGSAFSMGGGAAAGLGLRVGSKGLPSEGANQAFAADLGLLWKAPGRPLQLGGAALRLPLNATAPVGPHLFALGAAWTLESLRLSLDGKFSAGSASLHAGLELPFRELLDFRLGLSTLGYKGAAFGPSAGLGLHYGGDLSLDYAATPTASQGVLHSLSVGYRFGDGLDGFVDEDVREARELRARDKALLQERRRFDRRQAAAAGVDKSGFQLLWTVSGRKVSLQWLPPADAPGSPGTVGVSGPASTTNTSGTANIAGIPGVSGTPGTSGVASAPLRYTVTQGLLPTAKFRALNESPLAQPAWEGEVSLQGVTYYFRVLSVRADGSAGPSSAVTAVVIP